NAMPGMRGAAERALAVGGPERTRKQERKKCDFAFSISERRWPHTFQRQRHCFAVYGGAVDGDDDFDRLPALLAVQLGVAVFFDGGEHVLDLRGVGGDGAV